MSRIAHLLNKVLPGSGQDALARTYQRLFDPHSFAARCDYAFTDERLKFVHILEAVNYLKVADLPQTYFEFGCHSGRTFAAAARAARYLRLQAMQFFAFDSFQGLPTTDGEDAGTFIPGTFATSRARFVQLVERMSGLRLSAENVIEGFYADSLTPQLRERLPKIGVVHIDVDLYSSTVEVLNFIAPLLVVGTVIAFDDWYCFGPGNQRGEPRAFNEFRAANDSLGFEEWKAYSTFGKSFFVTKVSTSNATSLHTATTI